MIARTRTTLLFDGHRPPGGTACNGLATEIDGAWTYVGGSRACIDGIIADERFEAVETTADSDW
jgi:hypothetical protein